MPFENPLADRARSAVAARIEVDDPKVGVSTGVVDAHEAGGRVRHDLMVRVGRGKHVDTTG